MVAHCGTSDVRGVLGVGSATEFNTGTQDVLTKIAEADLIIDKRLALYNLTVTGTSNELITKASAYWSAALYTQDFMVRRIKGGLDKNTYTTIGSRSKSWWDTGSTFLYAYITGETEQYDRAGSRQRRMWSTTTKGPP